MERRLSGTPRPRPLDHGDPRTPMAWQYRNINYQQQHNAYNERFGLSPDCYVKDVVIQNMAKNQKYQAQSHRPMSPSTESSGESHSTAEPDTESQLKYNGNEPFQPDVIPGTLRSARSVLSTWDGEPCPVHHMAVPIPLLIPSQTPLPHSLLTLSPPPPPPPPPPLPPPAILLPPMLRPRPLVLPADAPAPPEPLPVRETKSSVSLLPPKEPKQKSIHCCKGHIIVLWIILSIIIVGVLLGVILRFVIA